MITIFGLGWGWLVSYLVMDLEKILQPEQLAVEVLCRRDSNLITVETILSSVIRQLKNLNKPLAQKLFISLWKQIAERRTNLIAGLLYLQDP